jgi:hypothetical protein
LKGQELDVVTYVLEGDGQWDKGLLVYISPFIEQVNTDAYDYSLVKDISTSYIDTDQLSVVCGWSFVDKKGRIIPLDYLKIIFVQGLGRIGKFHFLPIWKSEVMSLLSYTKDIENGYLLVVSGLLVELELLEKKGFKVYK